MQVEVLLNPQDEFYSDFVADFKKEVRALKGLEYKETEAPAPPKTLNVEHDVVKFVFEHGVDALKLVTTLLQIGQAVSERIRKSKDEAKDKSDAPVAVLKVDDRTISFPASDNAQRNLLNAVREKKTKKKSVRGRAKSASRNKNKKQK